MVYLQACWTWAIWGYMPFLAPWLNVLFVFEIMEFVAVSYHYCCVQLKYIWDFKNLLFFILGSSRFSFSEDVRKMWLQISLELHKLKFGIVPCENLEKTGNRCFIKYKKSKFVCFFNFMFIFSVCNSTIFFPRGEKNAWHYHQGFKKKKRVWGYI